MLKRDTALLVMDRQNGIVSRFTEGPNTLREAADKDYGLTVLSDPCLNGDIEVHRVLTEKVFPRQADVMTVAEWVQSGARREVWRGRVREIVWQIPPCGWFSPLFVRPIGV